MKRNKILICGAILLLIAIVMVSALTDIDDTLISTTGNLTLGELITFTLGESIDNIVDGWVRINGELNVTQNLTIEGTIYLKEQAEANLNKTAYGQIWVDTATPNTLFFTDDNDTDFQIGGLKTSYWSCSPHDFVAENPDTDQINYTSTSLVVDANGVSLFATVSLPHGAVITGAIVYGNVAAEAETMFLRRLTHVGTSSVLAQANINTEDNTISTPTIDNNIYSYALLTTTMDTGDIIYGARITYTTAYI